MMISILNDYKKIIERSYIDESRISPLNEPEIRHKIQKLYNSIDDLDRNYGFVIKDLLRSMTELYCYKFALEMTISGTVVPDSKDPDNKYVQARGAVTGFNKKRIWVSQYLGPERDFRLPNGKLNQQLIKDIGKKEIILKTLAKLLDQLNEQ